MKNPVVLSLVGLLSGAVGSPVLMRVRQVASLGCWARAASLLLVMLGLFVVRAAAGTVADSFDDWSTTGTQGENGWYGGYYDETADIEAGYAASDFTPFTSAEWDDSEPGGGWCLCLNPDFAWTRLYQEGTHPNGANSGNVHWTIRRWQADRDFASAEILWQMRKWDFGGNGVMGRLYLNGELLDSAVIALDDDVGVTRSVVTALVAGDLVDLALGPYGTNGTGQDFNDSTGNRLTILERQAVLKRGDADSDGALNLTDAVFTLNYLFLGGPAPGCLDAADTDDNGAVQLTDAVYTLNHLFLGGPTPPEPFTACGADGTEDELGCERFTGCQ